MVVELLVREDEYAAFEDRQTAKMLNFAEDAHMKSMSIFETDEHLRSGAYFQHAVG
jgi:hypothetical protein